MRLSILNCTSAQTALDSLVELTDLTQRELTHRLQSIPVDEFEEITRFEIPQDWLWEALIGSEQPVPNIVYWFHATRVPNTTTFADGLLPLPEAVAKLALLLGPAQASENHREKRKHQASWGPFGQLVREAAFDPVQDHFFRAPEAVVDLGYNIAHYQRMTRPCIVTFRATDPRDDVAALALLYAYYDAWGEGADFTCSTTWSGNGTRVPPEDIVRVEFLDDNTDRATP